MQGCTNHRCHIAWATKFYMVVRNISASSVWSSLHVTLLVSAILRWLLEFWKICGPLAYYSMYIVGSVFLKKMRSIKDTVLTNHTSLHFVKKLTLIF